MKPSLRSTVYRVGDGMFLITVGGLATWIMHLVHETGWGFVTCALGGMAAAMLAQMLLAWAVAPLLGSIESMVPSMIVGMLTPMLICGLHLSGCELGGAAPAALGAAGGLTLFALLELYGEACRRALRPAP
ncbi:MAG: hypothetical protein AMXMBFR47_43770 [Planctomycetota bacterium]